MKRIDHTQTAAADRLRERIARRHTVTRGTQQKKTSYTLYILKSIPAMGYPEAESDA